MLDKYITKITIGKGHHSKKFSHFYELLIEMTKRELTARYKNTLFGFLWVVINPLMQMFVIGFVFRFFIKQPIPNYYLYLLVGLLIWNFFSLSLSKATPSIVNERNLIKKAKFPREIIPISIIASNLIHLFIAFVLIIIPALVAGILSIYNLPRIFEGSLLLITFTAGLSLLSAALNVKYRDINFFIQALLIIWFYATPIVYSIDVIPYKLIWIWRLNPMTSVVQLFQNALVSAPPPGIGMLISNIAVALAVAFLGIKIFKKESKNFDDWI
jgi:lipopolysaccharide transport system permease protein